MHYEMLTKQSLFVRKTIIFAAEPIVPKYIRQPRCFNELKGHVRARLELQNCLSLSLSLSLLFSRFSLSLSLSSSSILFLGPKLRDRFSLWTDTHTVCTRLVLLHQGRLHEVMLTHLKFLYFIVEEIKRARFFLFFFLFFSFVISRIASWNGLWNVVANIQQTRGIESFKSFFKLLLFIVKKNAFLASCLFATYFTKENSKEIRIQTRFERKREIFFLKENFFKIKKERRKEGWRVYVIWNNEYDKLVCLLWWKKYIYIYMYSLLLLYCKDASLYNKGRKLQIIAIII